MKVTKIIILLVVLVFSCLPVTGEKRVKAKSVEELSNPKSHSYVPNPYPKNREEVIADLKYYAQRYCNKERLDRIEGILPDTHLILSYLLEPQNEYRIGEIIKIKNRSYKRSHDYSWLILIYDPDGNMVSRIALDASGLLTQIAAQTERELRMNVRPEHHDKMRTKFKFVTEKDITNVLAESLGRTIDDKEIKKMERVAYYSTLGNFVFPLWEIKMSNGMIYYYSKRRDMIYSIEKRVPWKKDKIGRRPDTYSLVSHADYLPDTISDELVVLKKIPRKKKEYFSS